MARMDLSTVNAGRLERRGASSSVPQRMAEHAMVELSTPLELKDGRSLPRGARGAIVFVHGGGLAYMVEFATPFHVVTTVPAGDLLPAITG